MAVFVPWGRRRSSIFDLNHIGGLSPNRTIPLLVSPQVLYALQNVALVEIADPSRYAVELANGGYYRVQPEDTDDYAQFLEIVSQTGVQLSDHLNMSTPLNYRESLVAQVSDDNADAGTNTLSIQGPGTDEAWVVERICVYNVNKSLPYIFVRIGAGSTHTYIDSVVSPTAGIPGIIPGPIHLSNGQELLADFLSCDAGNDIVFQVSGYIMELVV